MSAVAASTPGVVRTKVPARLDRLPWSRFHWRIVIGLGTVWILDGLEVTIVGAVASRLTQHGSGITISVAEVGYASSAYVGGACLGAVSFGYLTDLFGRKRLFMITLGMYILCTGATAASFSWWYFLIFRFLTGAGIGGEYASINSAIDELIPARARGTIDLSINGSYWAGSVAGSALSLLLLDESLLAADVGWRIAFAMGVALGTLVLLVRRNVPESPRWLFLHGREDEAEAIVDGIEEEVANSTGQQLAPVSRTLAVRPRAHTPLREIVATAVKRYPTRSILALALFVGQAFLYNGITFNLGTLMTGFFGVSSGAVPIFIIVYGASNLLGPLTIGRLFDTVGRRPMISATYLGSAVLGVVLALLFIPKGTLSAWTFMAVLLPSFFLASAGASAAYLTASEIFPMEMRALAIAVFYAVGTGLGGIIGPSLFGNWISSGSRSLVATAFFIGSGVMALGGVAELLFGVRAERAQLEDIAAPLTEVGGEGEGAGAAGTGGTAKLGGEGEGAGAAGTGGTAKLGGAGRHRLEELRQRERAAEERARAAEHRAVVHELLANLAGSDGTGGSPRTDAEQVSRRVEDESTLAEIADQLALAADEWAEAAAQLARAESSEAEGAQAEGAQAEGSERQPGEGGRSEEDSLAHRRRVEAALERALAHEEAASQLGAGSEEDARRHRELSAAAFERARRREQEALLAEASAVASGGDEAAARRVEMHRIWAQLHAERARGHELAASGLVEESAQAFAAADALEERGRAAAQRAEAAARHAEAREQSAEEEAVEGAQRLAAESARRRAAEERVRERIAERRRREVSGMRRYLPGPARSQALRSFAVAPPPPEEALDEQVRAIVAALDEHGAMDRHELARVVGARYWGPGTFSAALREALLDGDIRHVARSVYAPAGDAERHAAG